MCALSFSNLLFLRIHIKLLLSCVKLRILHRSLCVLVPHLCDYLFLLLSALFEVTEVVPYFLLELID